MRRLTRREWNAIATALNIALAAPVIDGFDDDSPEERDMSRAMSSALDKVAERL